MTKPVWPSATRGHRLKENSRTDRVDGYTFVSVVSTEVENGVEILWRTDGEVSIEPWGELQVLRISAKNLPPHLALSDVPRIIERRLREREIRDQSAKVKYEVEIQEKTTHADGSVSSTTDWCESDMSLEQIRNISHEDVDNDLRRIYEDHGRGRYGALRPARRSRKSRTEGRQ